jgi:hypothetical protein
MGACRSFQKPVWDDKQFVPRLFQPLSLSEVDNPTRLFGFRPL